jgi:hypothetical protein
VKKAGRATKSTGKLKADRTNKKAEVIAMMKRAKGATLAEIMKHGLAAANRAGLRQYPGQQGKRSSRPRTPLANGRTRSGNSLGNFTSKRRLGHAPGGGVHAPGLREEAQYSVAARR